MLLFYSNRITPKKMWLSETSSDGGVTGTKSWPRSYVGTPSETPPPPEPATKMYLNRFLNYFALFSRGGFGQTTTKMYLESKCWAFRSHSPNSLMHTGRGNDPSCPHPPPYPVYTPHIYTAQHTHCKAVWLGGLPWQHEHHSLMIITWAFYEESPS